MAQGGQSRNLGPLLIVLIVLLVSVGAYITQEGKWGEVLQKFGIEMKEESFVLDSKANEGKVIGGFPVEFLSVVSDAKVTESSRFLGVNDKRGEELLTVKYETSVGPSDMFAVYLSYFTDRGYAPNTASTKVSSTSFAVRGTEGLVSVKVSRASLRTSQVLISLERAVLE